MKTYEILVRDTVEEAKVRAREARRRARELAANIQSTLIILAAAAVLIAIVVMSWCAIMGNAAADVNPGQQAAPTAQTTAATIQTTAPTAEPVEEPVIDDLPGPLLETAPTLWAPEGGEPLTREQVIEALLGHGYLSDIVPMAYEYQDYMRTYCAKYGCPYPLALAVAEIESHFDMNATGLAGEVGIMQLNPGPGGSYHAEIEAATGLDPTTPEGNIAGGCYKLGLFMARYGDPATAVMAYRMGQAGADRALAAGVDPAEWSKGDMEAMERWESLINAWRGR